MDYPRRNSPTPTRKALVPTPHHHHMVGGHQNMISYSHYQEMPGATRLDVSFNSLLSSPGGKTSVSHPDHARPTRQRKASTSRHRNKSDSEVSGQNGTSTPSRAPLRAETRHRLISGISSARKLHVSVDSIIGSMRIRRGGTGQGRSPDRACQASPELLTKVAAETGGLRHSLDSSRDSFVAESHYGPDYGLFPERLVSTTPNPSLLPWGETLTGPQADSEENERKRHSIDNGHYDHHTTRRHHSHHRQSNVSEAAVSHQRLRSERSEEGIMMETGYRRRGKPSQRANNSCNPQSGRVSPSPLSSMSHPKRSRNSSFRNDDTSASIWPSLKSDAVDNIKGRLSRTSSSIDPAGSRLHRYPTFRSTRGIRCSSTDCGESASPMMLRCNTFGDTLDGPRPRRSLDVEDQRTLTSWKRSSYRNLSLRVDASEDGEKSESRHQVHRYVAAAALNHQQEIQDAIQPEEDCTRKASSPSLRDGAWMEDHADFGQHRGPGSMGDGIIPSGLQPKDVPATSDVVTQAPVRAGRSSTSPGIDHSDPWQRRVHFEAVADEIFVTDARYENLLADLYAKEAECRKQELEMDDGHVSNLIHKERRVSDRGQAHSSGTDEKFDAMEYIVKKAAFVFENKLSQLHQVASLQNTNQDDKEYSSPSDALTIFDDGCEVSHSTVLLERKMAAVFESFSLYGIWDSDKMALPHKSKGMGGLKFLKVCRASGILDGSLIVPKSVYAIFQQYSSTDTKLLSFSGFVGALVALAVYGKVKPHRVLQAVVDINIEERLLIYADGRNEQ